MTMGTVLAAFISGIAIGYYLGHLEARSILAESPAFVEIRCQDLCLPNGGVRKLEANARPRHRCWCGNGAFFSDKDLTR